MNVYNTHRKFLVGMAPIIVNSRSTVFTIDSHLNDFCCIPTIGSKI